MNATKTTEVFSMAPQPTVALMHYVDSLIGGFQKGNLYALGMRPGLGKTHFCAALACHWLKLGRRVMYVSDTVTAEELDRRLDRINWMHRGEPVMKECYNLSIPRLSAWLDEEKVDLLILDPFDVYCHDVDIGALKELAKEKDVTVLFTVCLPHHEGVPTLSTVTLPNERTYAKFLAYTSVILLGYRDPADGVCVDAVKNEQGERMRILQRCN